MLFMCVVHTVGDLILAEIYCVLGRFCGGMCCEREIMGMMERESWRSFLKCFLMWKGSLQGCLTHFCMSNYYWSFDLKMMRTERLTLRFRGRAKDAVSHPRLNVWIFHQNKTLVWQDMVDECFGWLLWYWNQFSKDVASVWNLSRT